MNSNELECVRAEAAWAERRREQRRPASGLGWMEPLDRGGGREWFRLMNVSDSGFRATHHCADLRAGQKVRFHHAQAKGVAVVMWNRLADGAVDSGFLIVSKAA